MRVLVCGGRDYTNQAEAFRVLDALDALQFIGCVIHGAARGADSLAGAWGAARRRPVYAYPANWNRDGKAAGPIRNQRMLDEAKPDMVLAFPGGRGTDHMISITKKAGVQVLLAAECPL